MLKTEMISDRSFFTTLHSGYYHRFLLQRDMLYKGKETVILANDEAKIITMH